MNDKPWNTVDPNDLVAVIAQWMEWRDALKGTDPAMLMEAVEELRPYRSSNTDTVPHMQSFIYEVKPLIVKLFTFMPEPEK